jgi:serine/threonine-protein kinase
MALAVGTRLGSYEILAPLGAGGMGEVYRARDTTLNREVAIKVLLRPVADDPDRLARFSREAQVLASLNHPNIAHIYGLEDADGVKALVLELVAGEDLAQRIARGPLPLAESLPIAKQIVDALEAAHDQGIVHRDLKPANIKVRSDGTVKVLDFGLAKAIDPAGVPGGHAMNSPTLSIHATQAGIILGTAAYMSPEQARGKAVDRRADIWAFGVVLFEMLTGKRAFSGDDISETLVSVFRDDPDWSALPVDMPPGVAQALRICLKKDPQQRVRDISTVRLAMEGALEPIPARSAVTAHGGGLSRRMWSIAMAGLAAIMAVAVTGFAMWPAPPPPSIMTRFAIVPPSLQPLAIQDTDRNVAISPDGTSIVYRVGVGRSQLAVRHLDQLAAQVLTAPSNARNPFFSADGRWIGFFDGPELKKVSLAGGPAITICRLTVTAARGASWGDDNTIVFASGDPTTGLLSVPADGGTPKVLTTPDSAQGEGDHLFPSILPGGRAVLFTITSGAIENARVAVLDLKTGQRKTLVRGGSNAEYVGAPTGSGRAGYLVYAAAGTLRAARFDLADLEVLSDPVPVLEHVMASRTGAANFAISRQGALVYVPGGEGGLPPLRQLVWVDRKGREQPVGAPPRPYVMARISPDGTRLALDIRDQDNDVWVWELTQRTLRRLTFDPRQNMSPVWTPDSQRIIFASQRAGSANLFWHAADGTGVDQRLTTSASAQFPGSVTPDGTHVLGYELHPATSADIVQVALKGAAPSNGTRAPAASDRTAEPLVQTTFTEYNAEISPDGRYLAYESNESGPFEIYVRPYPQVNDGRWQVSIAGGTRPAWARNGRELVYVDGAATLMVVAIQTAGPTFSVGNPAKVFDTKYATPLAARSYDVSPDGQRFLFIKEPTTDDIATSTSLVVVEHWFEELNARVPAK